LTHFGVITRNIPKEFHVFTTMLVFLDSLYLLTYGS